MEAKQLLNPTRRLCVYRDLYKSTILSPCMYDVYARCRILGSHSVHGFGSQHHGALCPNSIHTSNRTIISKGFDLNTLHQPSRKIFTFLVPKFIKSIIIDVGFSSYFQMSKYHVHMPYYYSQIKSTELIVRNCPNGFKIISQTILIKTSSLMFTSFQKWHKRVFHIIIQIIFK